MRSGLFKELLNGTLLWCFVFITLCKVVASFESLKCDQTKPAEQYYFVERFILLWMKSSSVTIQMEDTEQYFPVVLFIMLYNLVLTFESTDEILKCDHSNESS